MVTRTRPCVCAVLDSVAPCRSGTRRCARPSGRGALEGHGPCQEIWRRGPAGARPRTSLRRWPGVRVCVRPPLPLEARLGRQGEAEEVFDFTERQDDGIRVPAVQVLMQREILSRNRNPPRGWLCWCRASPSHQSFPSHHELSSRVPRGSSTGRVDAVQLMATRERRPSNARHRGSRADRPHRRRRVRSRAGRPAARRTTTDTTGGGFTALSL